MPMTVRCERGHDFQVEERMIGDRVVCPQCQWEMIVPDPRVHMQLRVEDDELVEVEAVEKGAKKKGLNKKQRLQRIDLGLQFHWVKIVCLLTGLTLWMLLTATEPLRDNMDDIMAWIIGILSALAILGLFVLAPILGIIGSLLCCFVPRRTGARPLIAASLLLDVLPFLLLLLGVLLALLGTLGIFRREGSYALAMLLQVLAMMLLVAGWACFMLFVRKLAAYLDEGGQHDEALSVTVAGVALLVAPGIIFGPTFLFPGNIIAIVLYVLGALLMVYWLYLVLQVMFRALTVIGHMRDVIRAEGGLVVSGKKDRKPPVPTPAEWTESPAV